MIPKVALGPLFIVWFSYGIVPNILIAFSICFFPILLTTARGLREVEPDLLDLVKSLRGSRWTLFRKIQLPGSLPYVFSGMAHCGGGAATASFATNQLKALTDWVEKDITPDRIVATNTNATSPYPAGGLFDPRVATNFPTGGTRPLCVYPKIASYKGSGMPG